MFDTFDTFDMFDNAADHDGAATEHSTPPAAAPPAAAPAAAARSEVGPTVADPSAVVPLAGSIEWDGFDWADDGWSADEWAQLTAAALAESGEAGLLVGVDEMAPDVVVALARQAAEQNLDAEWRHTITDPETGRPVHVGLTRRRPTAHQRRRVHARDRTRIFPGCRMPATQCDLDHRILYAHGGPTTTGNLGPVCPHDHDLRHRFGWTHQPLHNGDYLWTSALGHQHTTSGKPP